MRLAGLLIIFWGASLFAQNIPENFRLKTFYFNSDPVEVLVQSFPEETDITKPLFVFLQGSLGRPLVLSEDETFKLVALPFRNDSILKDYHIVLVSKPFIPAIANQSQLDDNYVFRDSEGNIPKKFLQSDFIEYYTDQINTAIGQLLKEDWVSSTTLVVAGHSQGSHIAVDVAASNKSVSHLIFSGGNPYGRILNTIGSVRADEDTVPKTPRIFEYYAQALQNSDDDFSELGGDSFKSITSNNKSTNQTILNLNIPILVSYGSRDNVTPYIDLLHIEALKSGKQHIRFWEYTGTNHNFFPIDNDGNVDYSINPWDKVAQDWYKWIKEN
ncbi:hypothetical protein [Ekhidna sp.]|uniref:hypothetical protein n=1 Tax=Ekhidna sp. TaxID=2608089 RepID=UPI0035194F89